MRTLAALLLAAAPALAADATTLAARAALKQHCHRCHSGPGSEGGEFDVLDVKQLTAARDGEKAYVAPGKAAESYLFERLAVRKGGKGDMPPPSVTDRPGDADRAAIKAWIDAGAAPFPAALAARKPVPLKDTLTAVRDHLRAADRADRAYLRFFTLAHLHNNPSVPDADLPLARAALSKAVNSLSYKPRVVVPKAVDPAQTLFSIDVRDYDWDRGDLWAKVLQLYPYGLKYGNHPDEALRKLDEDIEDASGCRLPVVRADWFVATATRPPLYHVLLRIPANAKDLEQRLGVDVAANFRSPTPDRIARAAFARSGVSGQNRLVERHDAPAGSYWKSYDFKADSPRSKLTRFPLGPLNLFPKGQHPYPAQAFVHDGGEIIFSLPNGLQGYMLVDGRDNRIDFGPIEVVGDSLKTSGTAAIANGVSCMACHKHGMLPVTDTVRAGSGVFGDAERAVRNLYPETKTMAALVEADEARYVAALDKAVGPFLRVGADARKPIKEFPEPVGDLARNYRTQGLGFLTLQTVAAELDVADPAELRQRVGDREFKRLGLDALLTGGVVGRLEWEAVDGVSLMQELARKLRYTPVVH